MLENCLSKYGGSSSPFFVSSSFSFRLIQYPFLNQMSLNEINKNVMNPLFLYIYQNISFPYYHHHLVHLLFDNVDHNINMKKITFNNLYDLIPKFIINLISVHDIC